MSHLVSLIVPTAGLFRHNEGLWPEILAASLKMRLELVLVCQDPPSPRLFTRLASLRLPYVPVVVDAGATVGEMVQAGLEAATGSYLIVMHDDVAPAEQMLWEILAKLSLSGMSVPHVVGSDNLDQDPEKSPRSGITTRMVDRSMFSIHAATWSQISVDLSQFEIDGYQVAIQAAVAQLGLPVKVVGATVAHEGSATLSDVRPGAARALFGQDVRRVADCLGVHVENWSRPALPRIIPKGYLAPMGGFFWASPTEVDELLNTADCDHWRVIGKTQVEKRIRLGHKYAIPSTMDTLDIAWPGGTGLGDALMHTAALGEFKRRYPHILIRAFSPPQNAEVFARCPAISESIALREGVALPASCVTFNNSNAWEGTADWGFDHLRIEDTPVECRRMFFEPNPIGEVVPALKAPTIGLQMAGGWRHKRYTRVFDLARSLLTQGFEVRLFNGAQDVPIPDDLKALHVDIWGLDILAAWQRRLSLWVGFDSGPSFLANALGVPTLWLFASHSPAGMIGRCGAAAPWRAIWPRKSADCARRYRVSCRPHDNAIFESMEVCPLVEGDFGAKCLNEIPVEQIVTEADKLLNHANSNA